MTIPDKRGIIKVLKILCGKEINMKKTLKTIIAAFLAAAAIACSSVPAFADTLKTNSKGITYLYSDSGKNKGKYTGFSSDKKTGKRYYYKNGVMLQSCWFTVNKKTYFAKKDRSLATGIVIIDNVTCYFDDSGIKISESQYISECLTKQYYGKKLTDVKATIMYNYGVPDSNITFYTNKGESLNHWYNAPSCYDITSITVASDKTVKLYGIKNRKIPDTIKNIIKDATIDAAKEKMSETIQDFFD